MRRPPALCSGSDETASRHHRGSFFFFNDTATTEIYTLSLHDALPISRDPRDPVRAAARCRARRRVERAPEHLDRKSTRLNSSHLVISYAVFCLKKKKSHGQAGHSDRHPCLAHRPAVGGDLYARLSSRSSLASSEM